MKSEELKSVIVFVGIISFSLFTTTTYINYHIYAFTQDGNQPYNPQSLWSNGAPLPTPRSEIAGAGMAANVDANEVC